MAVSRGLFCTPEAADKPRTQEGAPPQIRQTTVPIIHRVGAASNGVCSPLTCPGHRPVAPLSGRKRPLTPLIGQRRCDKHGPRPLTNLSTTSGLPVFHPLPGARAPLTARPPFCGAGGVSAAASLEPSIMIGPLSPSPPARLAQAAFSPRPFPLLPPLPSLRLPNASVVLVPVSISPKG